MKQKIPNNLGEAIKFLEKNLKPEDREHLVKNLGKDPWIHFGFGMNMRNNWKLWEKGTPLHDWFERVGIFHADDMSSIINKSFVRYIKNEPIELEEQVKHYQDYWKHVNDGDQLGTVFINQDGEGGAISFVWNKITGKS
jgi:hypothetical protein